MSVRRVMETCGLLCVVLTGLSASLFASIGVVTVILMMFGDLTPDRAEQLLAGLMHSGMSTMGGVAGVLTIGWLIALLDRMERDRVAEEFAAWRREREAG